MVLLNDNTVRTNTTIQKSSAYDQNCFKIKSLTDEENKKKIQKINRIGEVSAACT